MPAGQSIATTTGAAPATIIHYDMALGSLTYATYNISKALGELSFRYMNRFLYLFSSGFGKGNVSLGEMGRLTRYRDPIN